MGGWRDGPSYKFALVQKLSTVTKTKKPGGGSSLAHRMGQGVDWPEPAPKALGRGRGARGQPASGVACQQRRSEQWVEEEEEVRGRGSQGPAAYASPFSMRPSCSSRRPMRSPCSLTSALSARSSCITSSSFPASCRDIGGWGWGIRGHRAAALPKPTTR